MLTELNTWQIQLGRVLNLPFSPLEVLTGLRIGKKKTGIAEKAIKYRHPSVGITIIAMITSTAAPIAKNICGEKTFTSFWT